MGWPKGKPRPPESGRKKGTPNKKTQALVEKCEAKGLDVFDGMIECAIEAKGLERFKMLSEIAQYIYPKRKAVEIQATGILRRTVKKLDGTEIIYESGTDE